MGELLSSMLGIVAATESNADQKGWAEAIGRKGMRHLRETPYGNGKPSNIMPGARQAIQHGFREITTVAVARP
ncbi:hypothetical protein [Mesorhizobium sp. dw_380]|uniref:hypothetical protein n=1 Tax=Mesorhizobium sp. dw_380 TaxID=2812001 RepID=UPI001BDF16CC|nr:hypothetical protein [Mesorhizobium sp. dw_380]